MNAVEPGPPKMQRNRNVGTLFFFGNQGKTKIWVCGLESSVSALGIDRKDITTRGDFYKHNADPSNHKYKQASFSPQSARRPSPQFHCCASRTQAFTKPNRRSESHRWRRAMEKMRCCGQRKTKDLCCTSVHGAPSQPN